MIQSHTIEYCIQTSGPYSASDGLGESGILFIPGLCIEKKYRQKRLSTGERWTCAYSSNVAEVVLCIDRCFQSQHNLRTIKNEMRATFAKRSLTGKAMVLDPSSQAIDGRNSGARMSFEPDSLLLSLYTSHKNLIFWKYLATISVARRKIASGSPALY